MSRMGDGSEAKPGGLQQAVSVGTFANIYVPPMSQGEPCYINDHCFTRASDGTWHVFGISHAEPADPLNEVDLAHATAPSLVGPWRPKPPVLSADFDTHGEVHLWAPHVVRDRQRWWMFYCAGAGRSSREAVDHEAYRIHLATSQDLWRWERHPANPLFVDGYDARDPMVLRVGERWVMYYTATEEPAGGRHVVCARTSDDLVAWSQRRIVFRHARSGRAAGPCESPFVVERSGWYYLFIGPADAAGENRYVGTNVYRSRDPLAFESSGWCGHVAAHAAEVVRDADGAWHVSHCGWGQGGLHLAPLSWLG